MIGKKGRLFSNTLKGARASAVVYSIAEMAKENGLIPFAYFKYLHEKMSNLGDGDLEEPLPHSGIPAVYSPPDSC